MSEVFVASVEHAALQFGMSAAFVGFVVVAIVGGAAESFTRSRRRGRTGWISASASRSAARRRSRSSWRRSDARQLLHRPFTHGLELHARPGVGGLHRHAAALVANSGKSAWFTGTQMIGVYLVFAITLYLMPG